MGPFNPGIQGKDIWPDPKVIFDPFGDRWATHTEAFATRGTGRCDQAPRLTVCHARP